VVGRRDCAFGAIAILFPVCSLSNSPALASDPLFQVLPVEEVAGLDIGRGFDILSGSPRGDCVDRTVHTETQPTGQDDIVFQSQEVTSMRELNDALGVSASAQLKAGFGSASASASFSRSLQIQDYSLFYTGTASLKGVSTQLRDVHLKQEFLDLLKSDSPDRFKRFRTLCGDGYIGEFVTGGEFKAVVRIDTTSMTEREAISASVSASFASAGGAASFQQSLSKVASGKNVRVWTYRRGGNGAPIATTLTDIADQVSKLPSLVATAPVALSIAVSSYLIIINDLSINIPDLQTRQQAILQLAALNNTESERAAQLSYIINHPEEFTSAPFDLPKMAAELSALKKFQSAIYDRAATCFAQDGNCQTSGLDLPNETVRPARK
jgi:hypothetical protein